MALTDEQEGELLAACEAGDEAVLDAVKAVESLWDEEHLAQLQKLWDPIHRCLTDGTTDPKGGTYPLNRAILNGRQLYTDDDYIVSFVPKNEVVDVAAALNEVTEPWMRERYFGLARTDFPQMYVNEEWCEHTLDFLAAAQEFYEQAAKDGRSTVFMVDQ